MKDGRQLTAYDVAENGLDMSRFTDSMSNSPASMGMHSIVFTSAGGIKYHGQYTSACQVTEKK